MSRGLVDYEVVQRLQASVADKMTTLKSARERRGERDLDSRDERQLALSLARAEVNAYMEDRLVQGHELDLDAAADERLVEAIDAAMYGAGQLQELLDDPNVENIDINGCDEVWISYAGGEKVRGRPVAADDEDLIAIVATLASNAGLNARPFTPATPEVDLRLPDGSRLSGVMLASERPVVSIRRNRFPQMFLETLVELNTVSEQLAAFLRAAVRARTNIIVAGATDAGKTTLLRALINCIDPDERLITVERALELGLRQHLDLHPDAVELEEVLPDADGKGGVSMRQLVRRTRRHNPSRVIVGEVMGDEVVEMLSAMSQGNNGSLSTVHARSASDVLHRLCTYAKVADGLDFDVTHSIIASAVDFIVFVRKNPLMGNRRCVMEVLEVTGYADGQATRSKLFTPSPANGVAERDAEVAIMRAKELAEAGYLDAEFAPSWGYRGV